MADDRAPSMSLVLLDNPSIRIEAQYNPEEVKETIGAVWNTITVPGFSGTVKQFSNTKDAAIKFTLNFNAMGTNGNGPDTLKRVRKFMKRCTLPRGQARTIGQAAPPRLLLVWPDWFEMTTVLESGEITTSAWTQTGAPRRMSIDVSATQIRDAHFTGEQIPDDDDGEWYEGDAEYGP